VVIVNSLSLLGSSGNSNNTNRQTYVNNGNTNQNYSGQAKPNYNGGQQFGNTGNNYSNNNSNNSTNANVQNNGFSAPDNFPSEVGPEDFADDIPF
jgi:hypothetical protein